MKTDILNTLTRTFNRAKFKVNQHSPEILVVTGVVGAVASTVLACKATTKVNDILTEAKETVDAIHAVAEKPENAEKYSQEDTNKALAVTYTKTGLELAKLYAPAIGVGVLSVACILTGTGILRKRNLALTAAYTAVDQSFKEYRGRLVERLGKELDREILYNIKSQEVESVVVNEDGTETVVKTTVEVADPNTYSVYARFYDDGNLQWDKDPETNLMTLRHMQAHANDLLRCNGYLFLNDVYDMLGIKRTKAGQIVGWIYDEKKPNGDNFVDFGIYDMDKPKNRDFVNGWESTILLDFNVDGPIVDLI